MVIAFAEQGVKILAGWIPRDDWPYDDPPDCKPTLTDKIRLVVYISRIMTEKDQILRSFGRCSIKLAELLKGRDKLDQDDRTFIENHILIVQIALTMAKYSRAQKSSKSA
jgi:hypothetical protein